MANDRNFESLCLKIMGRLVVYHRFSMTPIEERANYFGLFEKQSHLYSINIKEGLDA